MCVREWHEKIIMPQNSDEKVRQSGQTNVDQRQIIDQTDASLSEIHLNVYAYWKAYVFFVLCLPAEIKWSL